jgi:hypothetical protein
MAKDAAVSGDPVQKFLTEKDTPYLHYVGTEGLDILDARYVANLRDVELKPWVLRGGRASVSAMTPRAPRTIAVSAKLRPAASSHRSARCMRKWSSSSMGTVRPLSATMPETASRSNGKPRRFSERDDRTSQAYYRQIAAIAGRADFRCGGTSWVS